MKKDIFIYGLKDPRNNIIRYVGKTDNLKRRMEQHLNEAKKDTLTHKRSWLRTLIKADIEPILVILEVVIEGNWQELEKKWITVYADTITNTTEGGDIPPSRKGKKQSAEHVRKRVEARKKKKNYGHSVETKAKISRNRKGKGLGNTHTKGTKLSVEHKRKVAEALVRFNKNNPNHQKGRTAWNKGKKLTEEHKANISKAKLKTK